MGQRPRDLGVCDLDGDGEIDIAIANGDDGNVSIISNLGLIGFAVATNVTTGTDPRGLVIADLDNDGDRDLAVANHDASTVSVHRFALVPTLPVTRPNSVIAAELDLDGDRDLATANQAGNSVSLLRNGGTANVTAAGTLAAGIGASAISAADFYGDFDGDLAVVNSTADTLSVFRNDAVLSFQSYGAGCAGTASLVPALARVGDEIPGNSVGISETSGKSGAVSLLFLASAQASAPIMGCTLQVGGLLVPVAIPLDSSGSALFKGTLRVGAASGGIHMQVLIPDTGSVNGLFSATNGVTLTIWGLMPEARS